MDILEKDLVEEVVVVEQKTLLTEECLNCGSDELVPIRDYKHIFGEEEWSNDGVVCKCGCFHYLDEDGLLTYEYSYKDLIFDSDEVAWKISDN